MSEELARILAECLDLIEKQGWSIEDCLKRYPAHQQQLQQYLSTAQMLRPLSSVAPRPAFVKNARLRLENRLATPPKAVTFGERIRHIQQISKQAPRRFAVAWIVTLVTVASLLAGGTGVAYASSNALPGDTLYPVKTGIEDARLAIASPEKQTDLLLDFTDERIDEIGQLAQQGRFDDIDDALVEYEEDMGQLLQAHTRVAYEDAPSEDALTQRIQQQLQTHAEALQQLQTQLQQQTQLQEQVKTALQQVQKAQQGMSGQEGAPGQGGETPGSGGQSGQPGNPDAPQGGGNEESGSATKQGGPSETPGATGQGQQGGQGSEDGSGQGNGQGNGSGGQGGSGSGQQGSGQSQYYYPTPTPGAGGQHGGGGQP